jgi:general secretion pathway protein K
MECEWPMKRATLMRNDGWAPEMPRNQRGVALIIVLLVTALLIALIFEFAYGTRISLRAAANYRDNQRAYYLARSGVHIFGKFKELQDGILQGEWQTIPIVSAGDTELKIRWEDESGKINVTNVTSGSDGYKRLQALFTHLGIDQGILDTISAWMIQEKRRFYLLSELHLFLSDEDFLKVQDFLTVYSVEPKININTAPVEVLMSLGLTENDAKTIVEQRKDTPYTETTIGSSSGIPGMTSMIAGALGVKSNVFKVDSVAKVGGYTKQIEAIITRGTGSVATFSVNYWREL